MFEDARFGPKLQPLKSEVIGDISNFLWVLMGTIGIVLVIACANVANLLLVRAEGRQQELAIRAALGAGWARIAGELLLESVTLGVAGGLLGIGVAYGALKLLIAMAPVGLPRLNEISIDGPVLLFAFARFPHRGRAVRIDSRVEVRRAADRRRDPARRTHAEPEPRAASRA